MDTRQRRLRARSVVLILAANVLACLSFGFGLATAAQGQENEAETDQRIVSLDATYHIDAANGKVDVVESITVANVKGSTRGSTTITSYYWNGQTAWVPTDAENLSITSDGVDLEYGVEKAVDEVGINILSVAYPTNLNYGQTRKVEVSYTLPSYPPDDPASRRRINSAYIDVSILVCCNFENVKLLVTAPASFKLSTPEDLNFAKSTSEAGRQLYRYVEPEDSARFTDLMSMDWFGVDENGLARSKVEAYPRIEIVSPPDDTEWSQDTRDFVSDIVSGLETLTTEDSPIQAASFRQGGAVEFDKWGEPGPLVNVKVPRDFPETGVATMLARRWVALGRFNDNAIATGLAIDLGAEAVRMSGRSPEIPGNPPAAKPLDDDGAYWVVRQISSEIGHVALGSTITMAKNNETAYLGDGDPERVATIENDWRRFLDLVELRAGAAGAPELFENYLLSSDEISQLQTRQNAIVDYEQIKTRAGSVPLGIRTAMTNWKFGEAEWLMNEASSVLDERDRVMEKAAKNDQAGTIPLGQAWETARSTEDLKTVRNTIAARDAELGGGYLRLVLAFGMGLAFLAALTVIGRFPWKKFVGRNPVQRAGPSTSVEAPSSTPEAWPVSGPTPTPPVTASDIDDDDSSRTQIVRFDSSGVLIREAAPQNPDSGPSRQSQISVL